MQPAPTIRPHLEFSQILSASTAERESPAGDNQVPRERLPDLASFTVDIPAQPVIPSTIRMTTNALVNPAPNEPATLEVAGESDSHAPAPTAAKPVIPDSSSSSDITDDIILPVQPKIDMRTNHFTPVVNEEITLALSGIVTKTQSSYTGIPIESAVGRQWPNPSPDIQVDACPLDAASVPQSPAANTARNSTLLDAEIIHHIDGIQPHDSMESGNQSAVKPVVTPVETADTRKTVSKAAMDSAATPFHRIAPQPTANVMSGETHRPNIYIEADAPSESKVSVVESSPVECRAITGSAASRESIVRKRDIKGSAA